MTEILVNNLYLMHAAIIWLGSIRQIWHIYRHKRARDVMLFWVACILASEFLALPRAFTSGYWVWYTCHLVSLVLVIALMVGVILYRKR